jgi:DNA-binding PadR family transcriptional regulator
VSAVFSHGRLRLYLLKLLAEGPKHGYELIRLLENRFLGLYAPSAGTIYPRLARMEGDGLVTHTAAGGRKVYEITDAGRAELAARADELSTLESEIHESVADLSTLAGEVERGVRGSVRDIKRELRQASRDARTASPRASRRPWTEPPPAPAPSDLPGPGHDLEQAAAQLLAEVRRLARGGRADADTIRAAAVVVDAALTQLRKLRS